MTRVFSDSCTPRIHSLPVFGPAHDKHNKTQIQITMKQIQITNRKPNRWHTQQKQITRKKNTGSENEHKSTTDIKQEYNWNIRKSTKDKVTARTTHKRTHRSLHSNHSNFFIF